MKIRRVGAYGICRDESGRVLLARNSALSSFPGLWTLPGGGVDQGEHPDHAVVREFGEETGFRVRIDALHAVTADVFRLPGGDLEHTDRIVYDVSVTGGSLRPEVGGTTESVEWVDSDQIAGLSLMPFTAHMLGFPYAESDKPDEDEELSRPARVQRFGAYGAVTDPNGRILLTRIAEGYPGAGRWHLPGGGTDHGEAPEAALTREMAEETSQHGRVTGLLGVSHRHDPAAFGPEGVPIDWHVIRVLFRVQVDRPTEVVVAEETGGSTAEARWFTLPETRNLDLTEPAATAVARIEGEQRR